MIKTLLLQAVAILATAAAAALVAGRSGALSVLAGGLAYVLPNLLFVLRLSVAVAARRASAAGFLIGEAVKLAVVIVSLLALPRVMEIHWPALLAGLFVVMLANLFALLLKT